MSDLLAKVAAHYSGQKLTPVEVPEWGATIWFKTPTAMDNARCHMGVRKGDDAALVVNTIIELGRDKEGKPLFGNTPPAEIKATLMGNADYTLLVRIMTDLGAAKAALAAKEAGEDPATKETAKNA